jgi:hypothetical protein
MVEVTLTCEEGHEFTQTFQEPIDWPAVNAAVKAKKPRCKEHTQPVYNDWCC